MKIRIINNSENKGFLMLRIENPIDEKIKSIINPDDLAEDGFELDTHITIVAKVPSNIVPNDLFNLTKQFNISTIKLGKVSLFENEDNDVLKFDVNDNRLTELHDLIHSKFNFDEDYPTYNAHCTIAYIKKGLGKKYVELLSNLINLEVKTTEYHYSITLEMQ